MALPQPPRLVTRDPPPLLSLAQPRPPHSHLARSGSSGGDVLPPSQSNGGLAHRQRRPPSQSSGGDVLPPKAEAAAPCQPSRGGGSLPPEQQHSGVSSPLRRALDPIGGRRIHRGMTTAWSDLARATSTSTSSSSPLQRSLPLLSDAVEVDPVSAGKRMASSASSSGGGGALMGSAGLFIDFFSFFV